MSRVEVLSEPLKSDGDLKEYRLIKLPNGLTALLVRKASENPDESDNELLAAASLTVKVGSFDDPPRALGLAHFLEHMVHMGSTKYPAESTYMDFLSANGGSRNANTGVEMTQYFFNVSEEAFPEALDRFEQLIESPLLLQNSMQREREAVDSEYNMQKASGALGFESILKSLIYDWIPASQFDYGNLKTLKDDITDDELHSELLKLHKKFVANKMFLAVQSSRSLNEQQRLVVESFSGIQRGRDDENASRQPLNLNEIFKPEFYNKIYYIKPKTPLNALFLTWAVPSIHKYYKCSPYDYIAHIFSNEGEDGIGNYLRERHYITEIGIVMEVNAFSSNSQFTLVRVFADLTALGYQNIDKILEAIASYLLMIKETPIKEHQRLYQELKDKSVIDFNFYTESSSLDNVSEYASNMMNFEDIDILRGNTVFQEFDENVIVQCINALCEPKFNLILITDLYDEFERTETYFETEYHVEDFPKAYEKLWREKKRVLEFGLEKPNPFKATNFEIFIEENESSEYPKKIHDHQVLKVWHTLDNKYQRPHVCLRIQMISPLVSATRENYVMMAICGKIFKLYMYKKISQASSAGYNVNVDTDRNGFLLGFEGFNEKIAMVVDKVTSLIRNCVKETDVSTFEDVKEGLLEYYSSLVLTIEDFNRSVMNAAVLENYFSPLEMIEDLDTISYNKTLEFALEFLQKMRIQMLAQGNITKTQTMKIVRIVKTNLYCEPIDVNYVTKRSSYEISIGSSVIRVKSPVENDDNSFIRNHYQIGRDTLRNRCYTRLVEAILTPKVYDFLRSKEQLGYSVMCRLAEKGNTIGIELIVASQEHKNPYPHVSHKMDVFMNEIAKKAIEELTDEDFESFKESRLKQLLSEDLVLDVEVASNWKEIKQQDYVFNRVELAAEVTDTLTKAGLQNFFKSFTKPENMRKLSVQVIGNQRGEEGLTEGGPFEIKYITKKLNDDENLITNIKDYQRDRYVYPVNAFEI